MLATPASAIPAGERWRHEVKWDGMRVLVDRTPDRLRIFSRNENDVTVSFPDLQGLAGRATFGGKDVVLDGEVVAFLEGLPVFGALAERMHVAHARRAEHLAATNPVTLLLFDLMHLDGLDLTPLPLEQRRQVLADLVEEGPRWRVPPAYDDGQVLLDATRAQGLEGIVSKRRGSAYRPGVRSPDWLKFPHRPTGYYVVGAWRTETASRRLGSVLVGEPTEEGLVYRGRVGSGLAGTAGEALRERLAGTEVEDSPFGTEVPREDRVGARWVRPEVVLEVASLGLTPQKRLRQPSYLGVRTDLRPEDLLLLEETLDG
jgi:bifunctional non-homologous end joining protein LigD